MLGHPDSFDAVCPLLHAGAAVASVAWVAHAGGGGVGRKVLRVTVAARWGAGCLHSESHGCNIQASYWVSRQVADP